MTRRASLILAVAVVAMVAVVAGALSGLTSPSPNPGAASTHSPTASSSPTVWGVVIDDQFDGALPGHWRVYDGPYRSGPHNCASPAQVTVHDGYLDLHLSYLVSGDCGPGWYSGGLALDGFSSVDARVTVRYRVTQDGGITAHRIIPMRWPDDDAAWPQAGEEDYCEGESLIECSTVMHYDVRNLQDSHDFAIDLTQWHTIAVERDDQQVVISVDGAIVWTYAGSATTMPATMKHVVLQQECPATCPDGTAGSEDILIDSVKVEVPK